MPALSVPAHSDALDAGKRDALQQLASAGQPVTGPPDGPLEPHPAPTESPTTMASSSDFGGFTGAPFQTGGLASSVARRLRWGSA